MHVEPKMVSVTSSIKITDEEFFLCCVCIFMKSRVDVNFNAYFKPTVALEKLCFNRVFKVVFIDIERIHFMLVSTKVTMVVTKKCIF